MRSVPTNEESQWIKQRSPLSRARLGITATDKPEVHVTLCKRCYYIICNNRVIQTATSFSSQLTFIGLGDILHEYCTVTTKMVNKSAQLLDLQQVTLCTVIAALSSTRKLRFSLPEPVSPGEWYQEISRHFESFRGKQEA